MGTEVLLNASAGRRRCPRGTRSTIRICTPRPGGQGPSFRRQLRDVDRLAAEFSMSRAWFLREALAIGLPAAAAHIRMLRAQGLRRAGVVHFLQVDGSPTGTPFRWFARRSLGSRAWWCVGATGPASGCSLRRGMTPRPRCAIPAPLPCSLRFPGEPHRLTPSCSSAFRGALRLHVLASNLHLLSSPLWSFLGDPGVLLSACR